jgi:uncharacterized protein with NRDE domain
MCLMAFALHPHPRVGLLLAANRDEALSRPTQALHLWHTAAGTPVWAGRDVREGGTWIGSTPSGRIGLLTNVRGPEGAGAVYPRSRGELVTRWLDTCQSEPDARSASARFIAWLGPQALAYGGFNLILGDVSQGHWLWLNNRPELVSAGLPAALQASTHQPHPHLLVAAVAPGVHGLSNAGLNTPWPKTVALTQAMERALAQSLPTSAASGLPTSTISPQVNSSIDLLLPELTTDAALWAALADQQVYADHRLPHTGVPWAWERALSATWVDMAMPGDHYGTRSSLLMQVQRGPAPTDPWQAQMLEHTWRPADTAGWVQAQWSLDGSS